MNDIKRLSIVAGLVAGILGLSNIQSTVQPTEIFVPQVNVVPERKSTNQRQLPLQNQHKYTAKEQYCMAKNIYHEAGVESERGMIAVGQVTLNRVATGRWGSSICSVVYAYKQFSWTLDSSKVKEKPSGPLWEASLVAANKVFSGKRVRAVASSLFYHTTQVNPYWNRSVTRVSRVGSHIFYEKS